MSKQKKEWIIDYIRKSPNQAVMALDDEFVEKYIETFNATYFVSKTGVKRSSYLRRLMLAMCEEGLLKREPVGLSGMPLKYPRWTHEYRVAEDFQ